MLQPRLDEITQNTRKLVQPERLALSEKIVAELLSSNIEAGLITVGSQAPAFQLCDARSGNLVRSEDLLALGPVILNFFRGRWDPYCVTELETWRDLYPQVRQRGALLAAITPQTVRQSDFAVQQHGLPFPLLYDEDCRVAGEFGIAYTVTPAMDRYYRSILVSLPFINHGRNVMTTGDNRPTQLPLPATIVLSREGLVLFAEAHADPRVRPEPEDILALL